ncbi:hypothetical protein Tco_0033996 [Tanacetum coccineum]
MAAYMERMKRFEEAIFKQREEINGRMAEMFVLLKELTASRTPKKVLVREEARHPVSKNVNTISLFKMEKEKNTKNNKVVDKNSIELSELNAIKLNDIVDIKNAVVSGTHDEPVRNVREDPEELVEMPRYNDSLLATRLGKMDHVTYNSLPRGPMYKAVLKKKITKKEDMGGNFGIPCIKEDKKKLLILGTHFLTTAKAEIRFDKGTTTLKFGKNKMNFFKILESPHKVEEETKNDIDPVPPTNATLETASGFSLTASPA